MPVETETHAGRATKVVVATSVMLTFISFWRAAAIVLCDLGSSAYYVGGHRRKSYRQSGTVVRAGHHAVFFVNKRVALHGEDAQIEAKRLCDAELCSRATS